jgi:uncharacterized secreted protein with C-terminal beta-propeller domain
MRPRHLLIALVAALSVCVAATPAPAAPKKPKKSAVALKAFQSCTGLIRYGNRNRGRVEPMRMAPMRTGGMVVGAPMPMAEDQARPAPAAAPQSAAGAAPTSGGGAAESFSTTNVQEAGVDEPDIVKTDGKRIFAFAGNTLHAVDVADGGARHAGALTFESGGSGHQILIEGDTLLITYSYFVAAPPEPQPQTQPQPDAPTSSPPPASAASAPPMYYGGKTVTRLAQVDVSDMGAMKVLRTLDVDGDLVDTRLVGSVARVVLTTTPPAMIPVPVAGSDDLKATGSRHANHWLPRGTFKNKRNGANKRRALTACRSTRRTSSFSGMGMLTILTIDLDKGLQPVDSDSLMTDAETVYASTKSLYVATRKWREASFDGGGGSAVTQIHRFDISDPSKTVYSASGAVPGYLLSQWSMSEHKGVLRVASTTTPTWGGGEPGVPAQSFVTTLRDAAGLLVPVGQVGGLGKGERIFAVRFIDDVGYVVTFRQTDPLYTVDLQDPAKPAILGELKILGYSAYLHPGGDNLLIGVGQDATEQGRTQGAQLSLFDVSDLRNPTRLHQASLGQYSSTEVEHDHHAFLFWQPTGLAMLPLTAYSRDESNSKPFMGAVGYKLAREGITEVGKVQHPFEQWPSQVRRSIVIGNRLFTLSDIGLKASALDTLADGAWVGFPK